MNKNLTATVSITIDADQKEVWRYLTDPALIKLYFFGTEARSAWKKGSSIVFTGTWEGKSYEDKGTILDIDPPRYLKYNYWSNFSGTPDIPENYANIVYELKSKGKMTELLVTQDGAASEEARDHSEKNWRSILEEMRKLLEKK